MLVAQGALACSIKGMAAGRAPTQGGPLSNGYATDMWTLGRVAEVIEDETGVRYHPGHLWRVLREMCRQRLARRAVERDDEAIARWAKDDLELDRPGEVRSPEEPGHPGWRHRR